jgi:hypothetical protein
VVDAFMQVFDRLVRIDDSQRRPELGREQDERDAGRP